MSPKEDCADFRERINLRNLDKITTLMTMRWNNFNLLVFSAISLRLFIFIINYVNKTLKKRLRFLKR